MKKFKFVVLLVMVLGLLGSSFGSVSASKQTTPHVKFNQNSKVQANDQKVSGTVKERNKTLHNSILLVQSKNNPSKWFNLKTNTQGKFSAKLPDGRYQIKALKNKDWYTMNQSFVIKKGKIQDEIAIQNKKKIKIQKEKTQNNVNGVLKEGQKKTSGGLVIVKITEEYTEEPMIIEAKNSGKFSAALTNGDYMLFGVEIDGGFYRHELPFRVSSDGVYINGVKQSSLNITLPENVYAAKIHDSEKPLSNASVFLEKQINEEETDFVQVVVSDRRGEMMFREASDGKYVLSVYHETFEAWGLLTFEIQNGKIFVNGKQVKTLDIKVPDLNLKGTLLDNNKPVSEAYLFIEEFGEEGYQINGFGVPVDERGNFQYRMNDGNYKVVSVDENGRNTITQIPFSIQNGKLLIDGVVKDRLQINLPPITFSGKLIENGNVLNGAVEIMKTSENGEWNSYYTQTDETGVFSLRLPDGQYEVIYAFLFDSEENVHLSLQFEIKDGKLFVNGEQKSLFEIVIPPTTLHGVVLDGGNPVSWGDVSVWKDDFSNNYGSTIKGDGSFSFRLPDGQYILAEIYLDGGSSVLINKSFTIQDGKLYVDGELQDKLEISLPTVSLKGVVLEGNSPVNGGDIYISTEDGSFSTTGGINEEGRFSFRLQDGNYKIEQVLLYDGTNTSINSAFSIKEGKLYVNDEFKEELEISLIPVNVTGSLLDQGNKVGGDIYIMEMNNAENPMEMWGNTDSERPFQFRLPDGEYIVQNVWLFDGTQYNPSLMFKIENGQLFVNGEPTQYLNIDIAPVTVSGTVFDGESAVREGHVSVVLTNEEGPTSMRYTSFINEEGKYSFRLPDGDYLVESASGYYDREPVVLNRAFTVENGKIIVDGAQQEVLNIQLQDGTSASGDNPITE